MDTLVSYFDVDRLGELLLCRHFNRTDPSGLASFERQKMYEMMKKQARKSARNEAEYEHNIKLVVEYLQI